MAVENEAKERLLLIVHRSLITWREKSLQSAHELLVISRLKIGHRNSVDVVGNTRPWISLKRVCWSNPFLRMLNDPIGRKEKAKAGALEHENRTCSLVEIVFRGTIQRDANKFAIQ